MRLIGMLLLCLVVSGCRVMVKDPDRPTATRWEYRTVLVAKPNNSALNRYADDGWEIVSFAPVQKMRDEDADNWMLLLRRAK